jgi:hypothetical protein
MEPEGEFRRRHYTLVAFQIFPIGFHRISYNTHWNSRLYRLPSLSDRKPSLDTLPHLSAHAHHSLASHRQAVLSEITLRSSCESHRILSTPIIAIADSSLCKYSPMALHIPFGEVCHIAMFRYSLTAKATPSSKKRDFLLMCLPRRGQGGGDRVSNQSSSHRLSCPAHLGLLFTCRAKASP